MRHGNYTNDPNQKINWQIVKMIAPYLLQYKARILVALLFLVAAKMANIYGPFLLKFIVDSIDTSNPATLTAAMPVSLVLAFGLAKFSNVMFGELRDTVFGRVTERAMRKLGLEVFRHIHSLDLAFHLNRRTGGLARDMERGTTGISFLMRFFIFNIFPTLFEIIVVVGILLFNYGLPFALITAVSIGIYITFSVIATEWRTQFVREANKADSDSNTRAVDSLLNFETVKYFTNEDFEAKRYDDDLEKWEVARRKNRMSLFTLNGGQAFIIAIAQTAMIGLAASKVVSGEMTLGDFTLINAFMMQLFMPLSMLGFVYREIKGSMANIENMFDLMKVKPQVVDKPDASILQVSQGRIVFDNVSFQYRPDRPILKNISFTIEPGQKVAVVGASGAGKSTLSKLLLRFYDLNEGKILIDDQDIKNVTQQSLRKMIGIVPQDTVLFNDSIFENIRYGRPDASDSEVDEAIRLAHLDQFIKQLPEGHNTTVGERGLKLSGGEKQRVAIARTILKRSPILLFDEATSSLDSKSEQAILAAIKEIAIEHTSLVIAHRLSTIVDADRILVLSHGELVEQGNHQQLLDKKGYYADLWQVQQKERQKLAEPS